MKSHKLQEIIDTFLSPVEAPVVLICLYLGGLLLIIPAAFLSVPLGILTVALAIYVITSPLWIYEIISHKRDGWPERLVSGFLRRTHLAKFIL